MLPKTTFTAYLILFCLSVEAKSPAVRKSELDALMPSGKIARMCWAQRPNSGNHWTVYVCESTDGVVRELTPASLFTSSRSIPNPLLSQDGKYVVFKEVNTGRIYAINWDGTNLRQLSASGCLGVTWEDPSTKVQYVSVSGLSGGGTVLMSITDPSQRRTLWNTAICEEGVGGIDGMGISVDGLRVGGYICNNNRPGIAPTQGGNNICTSCGGCNFAMRPVSGNAYEFGHFPDGHEAFCMHRADGSKSGSLDISSTILSWWSAQGGGDLWQHGEPVVAAFTNDPNYVTYQWGSWKINPILFCVTTKKWVGIHDDLTSATVNRFGVVFIPTTFVETKKNVVFGVRFANANRSESILYSLNGRRTAAAAKMGQQSGIRGVVLSSVRQKSLLLQMLW